VEGIVNGVVGLQEIFRYNVQEKFAGCSSPAQPRVHTVRYHALQCEKREMGLSMLLTRAGSRR